MATTTVSPLQRFGAVLSKRAGVAIAVWGEPGVGKTHTVQGWLRELPCRGISLHATTPNLAILRALPHPERLPVWAEQVVARLERGESAEPKAISDALAAWLAALAPFLLHVEDLHEADPERTALWTELAATARRTRGVGLIVTSRTEPGSPFDSHPLQPLEQQSAAGLLDAAAGSKLPPEANRWIQSHAHGNPLFTLEYFRHLTRLGHLWSDGRRWRWRAPESDSLPTSVEAIIAHHLHAIGTTPETRAALAARAVLPHDTSLALWAAVAGLTPTELETSIADLERGKLLRDGAFAHPLYRETLRADLSRAERRDLARRAVAVLSAPDPVAAVEFIAEADLDLDAERDLLGRAVKRARQANDLGNAARLLSQIAARSEAKTRVDLLLEAARLAQGVNLAEALGLAQQALTLDDQRLAVRLLTAELLAALGRGDEAERLLEQLSTAETEGDTQRVFETRVRVKHLSHDYAGVLQLWEGRNPEPPGAVTQAMIARAMVQINHLEAAETMLAGALTAPKLSNLELAELLYVQSFVANFAGRYAAAETGFTTFLHTLEALSDGSPRYCEMRAGALQLRAYMRNVLGRPAEATEDIRQALPFHAEIGDASHYAQLQSELGLYLLESGEYGSAEDVLQEARSVLERIDNPIYLSMLERIQARLYLESAPPHGAALSLKHARAALSQIERAGRPPSFMSGAIFITAWAEALHGRPEESLRLANELEELPAAQPSFAAGAAWVRALAMERLGDRDAARDWFQRAAERAAPMRLGPTLERMNLELDRLNGDLEGAARRAERFESAGALSALWVTGRYFPELRDLSMTAPNQATEPQDAAIPVHLEVLGPIRITVNTTPLRRGGGKANEFLVALLEARLAGRFGRSDLELFDALYPAVPEDRAASALKQLVYRLRAALGAGAILRLENGYALGAVTSDAERFLQTGDTQLWRGPYQSGPLTTSSAADRLLRALHERIRALETTDDPSEAARIGALLLEANPFDLEVLALSLRALEAGHDARGATRLYEAARAQFAEIGENLPATWQDFRARYLA